MLIPPNGNKQKNEIRISHILWLITFGGVVCGLACVAPFIFIWLGRISAPLDMGQCVRAINELSVSSAVTHIPIQLPNDQRISISPDTASGMVELNRLGRGFVREIFWSPDDDLMVLTSVGLWKHQHNNLEADPLLLWSFDTGIVDFTFSLDRQLLAIQTTSHPATIPIWDGTTGREILKIQAEGNRSGALEAMVFSPDNTLFAAAIGDDVHVWHVETGEKYDVFSEFTGLLDSIAFSPDSQLLAAGGSDKLTEPYIEFIGTIRIWDVTTGSSITSLRLEQGNGVDSLAFSPDGNTIISGGSFLDNHLRQWEIQSGEQINVVDIPRPAGRIVFNENGSWLAVDGRLHDGQRLNLVRPVREVNLLVVNDDGSLAAISEANSRNSFDQSVRVYDTNSFEQIVELDHYREQFIIREMEFDNGNRLQGMQISAIHSINPARTRLALTESVGSSDAITYIRLCDIPGKRQIAYFRADLPTEYTPDGRILATINECGKVDFRNSDTGEIQRSVGSCRQARWGRTTSLAFNPQASLIAIAKSEEEEPFIEIWDVERDVKIKTLNDPAYFVHDVAFSPDGKLMLYSSADQTLRFWGVPTAD